MTKDKRRWRRLKPIAQRRGMSWGSCRESRDALGAKEYGDDDNVGGVRDLNLGARMVRVTRDRQPGQLCGV